MNAYNNVFDKDARKNCRAPVNTTLACQENAMGYSEDVTQLILYAKEQFPQIKDAYNASLHAKIINPKLLIEIKNLMENLRSALDFTAHGLFEKYGTSKTSKPRIYFPYASTNQTEEQFQKSKRIDICIPGLSKNRPDIVTKILSYQHFADVFSKTRSPNV